MTIRMIIADDHPLIIDALDILFSANPDFQVVARCADGDEALKKVRELLPDIIVLDIRMPVRNGIEVAREMQEKNIPTRVVLLTAELDDDQFLEAMRAGVQGIVLKEMAPQILVQCIRKVHGGGQWFENVSTRPALEKVMQREAGVREVSAVLTPREIELVRMIANGFQNKVIAEKLFISEGTVKVHLHNIYEKLNIDGRSDLLRYAQREGLV
jgi:DNA-binding NarL/FixJ family response regulator